MSTYRPKLSVGDTAYRVAIEQNRYTKTCPLCSGRGKVNIEGSERTVSCPECHWGTISVVEPKSHKVSIDTVGQVRIEDTGGDVKITYMLESTGVGSGGVWAESDVFTSHADAKAEASARDKSITTQ